MGIEQLDDAVEIGKAPGQSVDLINDNDIDAPRSDVGERMLKRRPFHRPA